MGFWLTVVGSDPAGTDGATCRALCQAGPTIIPSLVEGLHRRDSSRLYVALWPRLPGSVQKRLPYPANWRQLRLYCAFILGYIAPSTPQAVHELRRALSTGDNTLTAFAAQALRMMADREPRTTTELAKALPELRAVVASKADERGYVARAILSIERISEKNGAK
jgi:hypothetical protein